MSKSSRLSSFFCAFAFALGLGLGAAPAQAAPILIDNVPADIYAVTTDTGGVYAFNPGTYAATNTSTADWASVPPAIGPGNFPGSLQVDNGVELSATGDGATGTVHNVGLALQTGSLVQQGGAIAALGKNTGDGITLGSGSFSQFGGTLVAAGENTGAGIALGSGDFTQKGGVITATGDNGNGIYLDSGVFTQSGGLISAEAFSSGYGIYVDSDFTQGPDGVLRLLPGDGSGNAVYLSSGDFIASGELQPGVDLAAGASGVIGQIYLNGGGATINPGAQLTPILINSLALAKGTSTGPLTFMAVDGSITGDYPAPADTLTMHYTLSKTNGDTEYNLAIARTAAVSDLVSAGNNSRMARALEKGAPWLIANRGLNPAVDNLFAAYDLLDMSQSRSEMTDKARSMTGSESMRLPLQAL